MLHQIKSYFRFLWNSKNQHGVHSPFVFALVTQCFYDKKKYPEYLILKKYRASLLQNKNKINVIDYGAGSKVFKSNVRAIHQIAKNAGIGSRHAELLFRIVRHFQPDPSDSELAKQNILEIGTSVGLATSALSLGNPKANITTLEGCPATSQVAALQFKDFGLKNVDSVAIEFETYLKHMQQSKVQYDLIYFDGNHQKEATLHYFELLLPTISNNTVWIFDDIHWSTSMEEAWEMIKKHPQVTVTIDTFQWGLVFFRSEQEKEHFVIRV